MSGVSSRLERLEWIGSGTGSVVLEDVADSASAEVTDSALRDCWSVEVGCNVVLEVVCVASD